MIELTKSAVEHLKVFSEEEGIGHTKIRVKVCGGKCSGLYFDMLFEDLPNTEMDEIFEQDGITIIIDCLSLSYIRGEIILDWVETPYGGGFKFSGDEEYKSCGCGSSFSPV